MFLPLAKSEAGRVGEVLITATAEEVALDERLDFPNYGISRRPGGQVHPRLPGVSTEAALLLVGAVRRDGAGREGVAGV